MLNTAGEFKDFLDGYVDTMLWCNAYTDGPGDEIIAWDDRELYGVHADVEDPAAEDLYPLLWAEALAFFGTEYVTLKVASTDFAGHGHDFALTRNGHGAGFWDRGYGPAGDALADAARAYGELNLHYGELVDGTTGWVAE